MVSRNPSFQGEITLANIDPLPVTIMTRFSDYDTLYLHVYLLISIQQKHQTKVLKVSNESSKC